MNLEESNSFMQEEAKRAGKKKIVIAFMALCAILIVLIFILIGVIQFQDSQKLKMFINGTEVNISSTLYKTVEDTNYVNIKEISKMLGYSYTQGEYNKYNEDESSCYLQNSYEIVALTSDETVFEKYAQFVPPEEGAMIAKIPVTVKSENGQVQKYTLSNPIQLIDGNIYVPFDSLTDMLNVNLNISQKNRIQINTLDQVVNSMKSRVASLKYTSMSGDYENLKAMLYGLAVVGDGKDFGVVSLTDGEIIIGIKYADITFLPNLKDFLVNSGTGVGIYSSEGKTVIKLAEYDDISIYDEEKQIYLVEKDGKYGILNRLGEVVIYPDYDQIGYKFTGGNRNGKDEYKIIFDKCIPVKEGSKYGLYNIEGEQILSCAYDELGSGSAELDVVHNQKSILEIPAEVGIKGIIISQNGMYGVYDVTSENLIVPCVCTKAYSITKAAQTTYYLEYNEQQLNLKDYLEMNHLNNISTEEEKNETENANAVEMEDENEVVDEDTNTVSVEDENAVESEDANTEEIADANVTENQNTNTVEQ